MDGDFQTYLIQRVHNGKRLAPLSVASHMQTWRTLQAWYAGEYGEQLNPALLTNYSLQQFEHHLRDVRRVKAATWNVRHAGLVVICEWIGDASLMIGIHGAKTVGNEIKWLNDKDFKRFVDKLERLPREAITATAHQRAIRNQAISALMLFAGLRVFEVMDLRKADVTIGERSGRVYVHSGKGAVERTIDLGLEARKLIAPWWSACKTEKLFTISKHQAQTEVTEIGRQAGIIGLSAHKLRHTFSKRVLKTKMKDGTPVPLNYLQRVLGHARLETTMRYIEPSSAELAEVMEYL